MDELRIEADLLHFVRGEDTVDVWRFPARRSPDVTEFIAALAATVDELVAAVEWLDSVNPLARGPGKHPQP